MYLTIPGFRSVLVAVVGVCLAVSACADAAQSDESDAIARIIAESDGGASQFQQNVLADGEVSFAEYEQAIDAAIGCMRDQGSTVIGPTPIMDGRYINYCVQLAPGVDADIELCETEFLSFVLPVWSLQQVPSGDEAERVRDEYSACVREAGLDVPEGATLADIEDIVGEAVGPNLSTEDLERLRGCIERYSNQVFLG